MTFEEIEYGVLFEFAYAGGWVVGYKVAENKAHLVAAGAEIFLAPETEVIPEDEWDDDEDSL
jgi:hypothetical protein